VDARGTEGSPASQDRGAPHKWLIALGLILGTFMETLDGSVANVALGHMKGTFGASTDEITWVLTSYLVANAVMLPIAGWLGNRLGRRRVFLFALTGFTLASLAAGAAPTLPVLVLTRVVQGVMGGAMVPMAQAITLGAFPKAEQGMATAVFGVGLICGPVLGPVVGGWITEHLSWPWIFWVNLPTGFLALSLAWAFAPASEEFAPEGGMDTWSLAFIILGLGSLELFLQQGERQDWFESHAVQAYAAASVLGVALFLWRSLTAEHPLVDLRIFQRKEYATGMFLTFWASFGMYAAFAIMPFFLQGMLGLSPTLTGVVLSPGGAASILGLLLAGLLMGRVDVRIPVALGFLAQVYAGLLLTSLNLQAGTGFFLYAWIIRGLGLGFVFVPIATVAMRRIPAALMGVAAGFFNLMQNEGGSIGIASATTLLQNRSQFHMARLGEGFTPYNGLLREGASALHSVLAAGGQDAGTNALAAQELIAGELVRQSYVLAFVDVFAFLGVVYLACLPFVLLLKDPEPRKGGGMAMH
jgi:DHA2 family multidrug resistance protein